VPAMPLWQWKGNVRRRRSKNANVDGQRRDLLNLSHSVDPTQLCLLVPRVYRLLGLMPGKHIVYAPQRLTSDRTNRKSIPTPNPSTSIIAWFSLQFRLLCFSAYSFAGSVSPRLKQIICFVRQPTFNPPSLPSPFLVLRRSSLSIVDMMITSSKYDIAGFDFIVFEVYHAALISDTHYTHTSYIIFISM